jgi:hypothetical protein
VFASTRKKICLFSAVRRTVSVEGKKIKRRKTMKLSKVFYVCLVVFLAHAMSFSQPFTGTDQKVTDKGQVIGDARPFDFSDKFYEENGIQSALLLNRRSGLGKYSIPDFTSDPKHRNVRLTATWPAYDFEGNMVYFNYYGDFSANAFTDNLQGKQAAEMAELNAIYSFPSAVNKGSDRQAVLIDTSNNYYGKNPLGLGINVVVEYTERIFDRDTQPVLEKLAARNGKSLDGTPIIRTVQELLELTRWELITQRVLNTETSYSAARVIEDPRNGAIAPDAHLRTVTGADAFPLEAEQPFVENFECLQQRGIFCTDRK